MEDKTKSTDSPSPSQQPTHLSGEQLNTADNSSSSSTQNDAKENKKNVANYIDAIDLLLDLEAPTLEDLYQQAEHLQALAKLYESMNLFSAASNLYGLASKISTCIKLHAPTEEISRDRLDKMTESEEKHWKIIEERESHSSQETTSFAVITEEKNHEVQHSRWQTKIEIQGDKFREIMDEKRSTRMPSSEVHNFYSGLFSSTAPGVPVNISDLGWRAPTLSTNHLGRLATPPSTDSETTSLFGLASRVTRRLESQHPNDTTPKSGSSASPSSSPSE